MTKLTKINKKAQAAIWPYLLADHHSISNQLFRVQTLSNHRGTKSRWYLIDMLVEALPRGNEDQIIPAWISLIYLRKDQKPGGKNKLIQVHKQFLYLSYLHFPQDILQTPNLER
jgi:hypothetical protein